jgi:hypothetical protein
MRDLTNNETALVSGAGLLDGLLGDVVTVQTGDINVANGISLANGNSIGSGNKIDVSDNLNGNGSGNSVTATVTGVLQGLGL